MKSENVEKNNNDGVYRNLSNQYVNELKGLGFMDKKFGNKLQDTTDEVIQSVNIVANNIHEQLRREYAITFFNQFLVTIDTHYSRVNDIKFKLKKVEEECESKFIGLQNQINEEPKKFVKEIHRDFVNSVTVSDDDINVNEYIKTFNSDNGLYDLSEVSEKIIDNSLWKFSKNLPKALEFRNKKIDEVLSSYSEEELKNIINELIIKSNPLWSYNYKGYVINKEHHEAFVIGVPNVKDSILVKNKVLENILDTSQQVSFNSTS